MAKKHKRMEDHIGYYLVAGTNGILIKESRSEATRCSMYFKNCVINYFDTLDEAAENALAHLDELGTPFVQVPDKVGLDQLVLLKNLPRLIPDKI